jgi:hypothetical protein
MEYNLEDLDKAIFYYLSLNRDIPKSIHQIFNALIKEDIVPSLKDKKDHSVNVIKIRSLCHVMDNKFKPIQKIYKLGYLHLIYSDKNINVEDISFEETNIADSEELNYDDIITDLVTHSEEYPYIQINDTIDGKNPPLHLSCDMEDTKYLKGLLDHYNVDTDIKNSSNMTALEIAKENKFTDHVIILQDYNHNQIINKLKTVNQKLQSEYTMQTQQANFLRTEIDKRSSYLLTQWFIFVSFYMLVNKYYVLLNQDVLSKDFVLIFLSYLVTQSFFSFNILKSINYLNFTLMLITLVICYWTNVLIFYRYVMENENSFYEYWLINDFINNKEL